MSELAKIVEDMRAAPSLRRKLYYLSPVLTAAAFDIYERLGLRHVRVLARRFVGQRPIEQTEDHATRTRRGFAALGLDKLEKIAVLDGPFKGMIYGDFSHSSPIMPKILGVYESEIHPWINEAISTNYDCVINVGSAEGYYAVGFAYAKPGLEVFAFDTGEATDEMVPKLAALNNLQKAVHKGGLCPPALLESIASRRARSLVFVDIEGAEDTLLDIRHAPALRYCDIIVETHDVYNAGVTRRLIDRLWATHRFEVIAGHEDEERPLPDFVKERVADPVFARMFVSESRGMPQLYVRFKSRPPRTSVAGAV